MKKLILLLLIAITSLSASIAFTACNETPSGDTQSQEQTKDDDSDDGTDSDDDSSSSDEQQNGLGNIGVEKPGDNEGVGNDHL